MKLFDPEQDRKLIETINSILTEAQKKDKLSINDVSILKKWCNSNYMDYHYYDNIGEFEIDDNDRNIEDDFERVFFTVTKSSKGYKLECQAASGPGASKYKGPDGDYPNLQKLLKAIETKG